MQLLNRISNDDTAMYKHQIIDKTSAIYKRVNTNARLSDESAFLKHHHNQ